MRSTNAIMWTGNRGYVVPWYVEMPETVEWGKSEEGGNGETLKRVEDEEEGKRESEGEIA